MIQTKKVLHIVTNRFYPVVTGLEVNTLQTYANFAPDSWDITVYTSQEKNTPKNEIIKKIITIKRYTPKLYTFALSFNSQLLAPDSIVCLHDFTISSHILLYFKTALLKLIHKKKFTLIFSSHGLLNYNTTIYPGLSMKCRKIIEKTIGIPLINYCSDGIRAVSQLEKKGLISLGIEEKLIHVITNGLEDEAYMDIDTLASTTIKKICRKYPQYILQVSRIDKVKNLETVLRALALLPDTIYFLIAGEAQDKKYKQELITLLTILGLKDRVLFLGLVTGVDKYYLMKHALCAIQMSHSEAFGNSIHEALSQGTICIVSNTTGLTELVTNNINGYTLGPTDVTGLAEKVRYISQHRQGIPIKNIQTKQVTNNSWVQIAKKVAAYYLAIDAKRLAAQG